MTLKVEHSTHVAMGHTTSQLNLVPETRADFPARRDLRADSLQRQPLTQFEVASLVDLSHSAPPEKTSNLEAP